ncbi:hypothetical protein [Thiomicrospira sp. ALE5]|uniref:hypothetical protein n=1 Tax=Thiomicrospira sp. ALE5 TaxID=748650 RepID=UPI0008E75839|nr:hypothetical protein [Thiomicrospira sp. ALE5]SFR51941.1 hypothetical protein SAMN03092900_0594 [Thiomicrospira sp. ALE5]
MERMNIIVAHPERLVGQAVAGLLQSKYDRLSDCHIHLYDDMTRIQACMFNQQALNLLAHFDVQLNWLLIVDLNGFLPKASGQSMARGLGVFLLPKVAYNAGSLVVAADLLPLGELSYNLNSKDFLPMLRDLIARIPFLIASETTYFSNELNSINCLEVADSVGSSNLKSRVGLQ